MIYDFDTPVSRRNTHSLKWDVAENELPMWVADMDFETAPEIKAAIAARAAHGVFGYTCIPGEWYQAYISWWKNRHGFLMERQWLMFCSGIVPAISAMVRRLTAPGEKVLLQTPVYNAFYGCIAKNDRQLAENPLKYDGREYSVDFEDLEKKLADKQVTLMILCNPHNPVGKLWSRETLARIGSLCAQYDVSVISDEIHCDLTAPGSEYIPFASVSEQCRENSITCISPTKAFNLAGLQTAAIAVANEALREKVSEALKISGATEPNFFAIDAAIAAFSKGEQWLDGLRAYISENKAAAAEYIKNEIDGVSVTPSQSTYLLWLDCTKIKGFTSETVAFIRRETGLYLSPGGMYGSGGEQFIRMNAACPRPVLNDGLLRLKKGIAAHREKQA